MKWNIVYQVVFGGVWEMDVEAETKEEAMEKLKEMVPDEVHFVKVVEV